VVRFDIPYNFPKMTADKTPPCVSRQLFGNSAAIAENDDFCFDLHLIQKSMQ